MGFRANQMNQNKGQQIVPLCFFFFKIYIYIGIALLNHKIRKNMRKIQIYFVIMYIPGVWDYVQNWWRYRENDVFDIENDIGSASGQI